MSTSLLYHACGVRGYQLRRSDFVLGRICFWVEQPREKYRCPACGSAAVNAQGKYHMFYSTPDAYTDALHAKNATYTVKTDDHFVSRAACKQRH